MSTATIYRSNLTLKTPKYVSDFQKFAGQSGPPPLFSLCFNPNSALCSRSIAHRFVVIIGTNYHFYLPCFNMIFIIFLFYLYFHIYCCSLFQVIHIFMSNTMKTGSSYCQSRRKFTPICHKNPNSHDGAKWTTIG